jgi:hypothetical protein
MYPGSERGGLGAIRGLTFWQEGFPFSCLNSGVVDWELADVPELRSLRRIVRRNRSRRSVDLETTITALMSGEYNNPLRVVAFNTAERWADDVSAAIAREILRRLDLAGDELPSCIEGFIARHVGPDRQLTLRLA